MEADFFKSVSFVRNERIKSSETIRYLFREGKKVSVSGAKLFYAPNGRTINRIGFPLSRHYGNSVSRNHSKRISREVYRLNKLHLVIGYDILLLVYPGNDTYQTRCDQFQLLCKRAGLVQN